MISCNQSPPDEAAFYNRLQLIEKQSASTLTGFQQKKFNLPSMGFRSKVRFKTLPSTRASKVSTTDKQRRLPPALPHRTVQLLNEYEVLRERVRRIK
jgi:hypothetical protein